MPGVKRGVIAAVLLCALTAAPSALADSWLPHGADATWTYSWVDSQYNTTPTSEQVSVKSTKGNSFTLGWTTEGQGNASDSVTSTGTIALQENGGGISVVSPFWSSNAPPPSFPILCANAGPCPNSLASTYYNVIWGSLTPLLSDPLLRGTTWTAVGGDQSITSTSTYVGTEAVSVPAFSAPVVAAKIRTDVVQAGALGDPYGSGVKTVWWVYGVGPVKVVFQHAGGATAPVTIAVLQSTNQTAKPPPSDVNWFPMR